LPLRARHTRSARQLHLHAQERRYARNRLGSTKPPQKDRKRTNEARRIQPRGRAEGRREGNKPLRHKFVVELKDLIVVPNIADRLRPPVKSDKILGPHKGS